MASGSTHATVSIAASVTIQLIPQSVIGIDASIFVSIGCLAGCILSPDLDVDGKTYSNHIAKKVGGNIFEMYWRTLLYPYREALKHRSFWSHFPLVSTLIRLIYLCCPLIIVLVKDQPSSNGVKVMSVALVSQVLAIPFWGLAYLAWLYPTEAMWWAAGLAVSDFLHWVADQIF